MSQTKYYAVECIRNNKRVYWADYYTTLTDARRDANQLAKDNPHSTVTIYTETREPGKIGSNWLTVCVLPVCGTEKRTTRTATVQHYTTWGASHRITNVEYRGKFVANFNHDNQAVIFEFLRNLEFTHANIQDRSRNGDIVTAYKTSLV